MSTRQMPQRRNGHVLHGLPRCANAEARYAAGFSQSATRPALQQKDLLPMLRCGGTMAGMSRPAS